MPTGKPRVSLLDGHSTRREMPTRHGTEDLLNFEMEATHHHPFQRQRPAMRDLERPNLRDIDSLNVGAYDLPTYNERERGPRYKVRTEFNMPGPRQLEANFARLNRDHPLKDPQFNINMRSYRPKVVEVLGERQGQEKTMQHQQPHRGHEEQIMTWTRHGTVRVMKKINTNMKQWPQ